MNRREILRYAALVSGSAVSASLASVILSGCSDSSQDSNTTHSASYTGDLPLLHYFTPDQFRLVALLADTILPRTDSPSATDVNVHVTIDSMLGRVFDDRYKASFKRQWAGLEQYLGRQNFSALASPAQVKLLRGLELSQEISLAETRQALVELKQQTVAYYLTTKEIGTQYLNYLAIPGEYKPCISVEDVNNKAWAI